MTVEQIRYFTTVAQLENISKAAELLHLSQSSLSKSIARLETELGTPLFVRGGKSLSLNAAGARFLECGARILRELEEAQGDIRLLTTGWDDKLKLGFAADGASLVGCVAAFLREHPGAEFDLRRDVEREEHPDINEFDALVYPDEPRYEKFTGYPLGEERWSLAVPAGHPLSRKPSVSPMALEGLDLVFLRGGKSWVEFPFRICAALALRFSSQCFADERSAHRALIASGVCCGFVPEGEADFYRGEDLRLLPVLDRHFARPVRICFRRDKHLTPLARDFRDFTIEYLKLKR